MNLKAAMLAALAVVLPLEAGTSTMVLDTQGRPLVLVNFKGTDGKTRALRCLLDTGCAVTLIHTGVPMVCLAQDRDRSLHIRDAAGRDITSRVGEADIEAGGIKRKVLASRVDLEGTRKWQDQPIDAVLGMDFLVGTKVILDSATGVATWSPAEDLPGTVIPCAFNDQRLPTVTLQAGGRDCLVVVDSGCADAFALPGAYLPEWGGTAVATVGGFGSHEASTLAMVPRISIGKASWTNATATIWNKPNGLLGCGALLAGQVEFDFAAGRVILGGSGQRSILHHAPEIPMAWDRTGVKPCLRVALVGHGTLLERAGAHVGDQVLKVGDLEGPGLTREALLALLEGNPEPKFVFAHRAKS
jgi:hypothetical protein